MNAPSMVDQDLVEMMSAVFADYREANPRGLGTATWDSQLWKTLDELGLVRLTGSEEQGGSGAGWFEAAELLRAAASNGIRVPLVEHDLLAGWLLEVAGLEVDESKRTVCILDDAGHGSAVPWARDAEKIVAVWNENGRYLVADVPAAGFQIIPGSNQAQEPRDSLTVDRSVLTGTEVPAVVVEQLRLRGALARSIQICAALDQCLALSVAHAGERAQFGRSLSRFQAVQHMVADIAAEAALARAATEAALAEAVRSDWSAANLEFMIAVARSSSGHAASVVVRNAHQIHGAMGTTQEHRLHEFTLPALAWRAEFGSVNYWDGVLTTAAIDAGSDELWSLITL